MGKKIYLFFLLFITYLILNNINFLEIQNSSEPYFEYMENETIRKIYSIAILLDVLSLGSVVILLFENRKNLLNKIAKFILFISIVGIFILIIYELYYGSTFYYGEVRDKQGLPIGVNNLGFLGSTIYFCLLLCIIPFQKTVLNKNKVLFFIIFLIVIILLQYIFFKIFETSWKMSSS